MIIKKNCQFYRGHIPCTYHKKNKRSCVRCDDFTPLSEKILIIKLEAIGDVLRTTSILPALKDQFPGSHITWITKKDSFPLLNNNYINRIFMVETNYLEFILNEDFDLGICLDTDSLSATILNLASCQKKKGFITNKYGNAIPTNSEAEEWWLMGLDDSLKRQNRKTYQEIIYEITGLKRPIYRPVLPDSILKYDLIQDFKKLHKINHIDQLIVGINTGGGSRWQWKKWTVKNYIKLIQKIKTKYPSLPIILYGGPEEQEFNRAILKKVKDLVIDTGCKNSLEDFVSLVSISDLFITPDSLGFHIASALNKTILVLVGPTSPWELDIFGKGEIIYPKLECIACYLNVCDKKPNCMESLTPQDIFLRFEKQLGNFTSQHS
jgi:ADP-heptose:LPS heptosyltransferase